MCFSKEVATATNKKFISFQDCQQTCARNCNGYIASGLNDYFFFLDGSVAYIKPEEKQITAFTKEEWVSNKVNQQKTRR